MMDILASFQLFITDLAMMFSEIKQSLSDTINLNHYVFFVNKLICRQYDLLQGPQMFRFEQRGVACSKHLINEL
jgi:hypothetical protein